MPNTKTKKFDWQIFLAVFCILLVICCATVCCVVSNTDKGVARAYDPVTNPDFYTNTKFYLNNLNRYSRDDVFSFVEYFAYGQEGIMDSTTSFSIKNIVGYIWFDFPSANKNVYLELEITQVSDFGMLSITLYLTHPDGSRPTLFSFYYDYNNNAILDFSVAQNDGQSNSYYEYDVTLMKDKSWATTSLFGSGFTYTTINMLEFNFNSTSDLGCILSSSTSFSTIPEFSGGGYEEGYQEGYDEGYQEGYDEGILDNESSYNQGYNDGVLVGSQFYKDMTYKEELYRLNESTPYESYTRNILDLTDFLTDAFDINQRWYWCTAYTTTSIGGGVLYYPSGTKEQFDNIGDVLTFYKENGNSPIYCIYDSGGSALHKFYDFVYIIDGYDFSIMLNDGYVLGYQQGLNAGNKATEDELKSYEQRGFENGKLLGLQIGREEGYNQGVLDANDYSFFGLFTAVFDAPITAIVGKWGDSDGDGVYQREGGMLNFYIPGLDINFAPFLLSLFTIGLIVLIIRFILARKS